jgi:hypothetical protein
MALLQPMGPPPGPVNIPPFQPLTSSQSANDNPSSPVFLRRGQDGRDTPTTAAARRARDVDCHDRWHRAHEEEVYLRRLCQSSGDASSMPLLSDNGVLMDL